MITLEFTRRFVKTYRKLDKPTRTRIDKALRMLASNPTHPSIRVKRIKGTDDIWEASAGMSIRMTFKFLDRNTIQLRNVGTHEQVFRPPY